MPDGHGTPVHRRHHAIRSRVTWRCVGPRSARPCCARKNPPLPPFPRPSSQGTLAEPPSPIMSGMSRLRWAALHLLWGAPVLPRRAGRHAVTLGEAWAGTLGRARGCAPQAPVQKRAFVSPIRPLQPSRPLKILISHTGKLPPRQRHPLHLRLPRKDPARHSQLVRKPRLTGLWGQVSPTTTFLKTCFVEPRVMGTSKTAKSPGM